MILGFAHITRNETNWAGIGVQLPSAQEKWLLMERRAISHRIRVPEILYGVPQENISYDTGIVPARGRLGVIDGEIALRVRNVSVELLFFRDGLGFQSCDGMLQLASPLRNWEVGIRLYAYHDAPIDPPLDIDGYAALAFYSSDAEADRDHLLRHGGRTPTEPFTVKLDREMKIVMLRSPEGTIIELIQVKR